MNIQIIIAILFALTAAFQGQTMAHQAQFDRKITLSAGADIDKGASITQTILDQSKAIFEQAYVFNGDNMTLSAQYIRTQLNKLYAGNYAVIIFNDNSASPIVNTNVQMSIQSLNNSWWFYWKGPNHYKPTYAYFIAKNAKNTSGSTLIANGYDLSTSISTISKNVINAVQQDSTEVSYNVQHIKSYIAALNSTRKVNIIITKNVSYYLSVQGTTSYQHLNPTPILKNNDLIWYTT